MSDRPKEFLRHRPSDSQAHRQALRSAREAFEAAGDSAGERLDAGGMLGALLTADGDEAEACRVMEPLLALARAHPALEPSAWLLHGLATAWQYAGRREEADALFAEALDACRSRGWPHLEHFVLHHRGRCLAEMGRREPFRQCFEAALAIRAALGDPREASSRRALEMLADWKP